MLTEKEKLFLKTVLNNKTYKDAAIILGISEEQLRDNIKIIYNKLGVKNRIQACLKVYKYENISNN